MKYDKSPERSKAYLWADDVVGADTILVMEWLTRWIGEPFDPIYMGM